MNKREYINTVHEQLQAYGYEPTDTQSDNSIERLYINKNIEDNWTYVTAVTEIEEDGVAPVRNASNQAREMIKSQIDLNAGFVNPEANRAFAYLLLLPPSISEQMEIYVEEGHNTRDADTVASTKSWLYPILVDVEGERIVYRQSKGLKKLFLNFTLEREVEKLFQI